MRKREKREENEGERTEERKREWREEKKRERTEERKGETKVYNEREINGANELHKSTKALEEEMSADFGESRACAGHHLASGTAMFLGQCTSSGSADAHLSYPYPVSGKKYSYASRSQPQTIFSDQHLHLM